MGSTEREDAALRTVDWLQAELGGNDNLKVLEVSRESDGAEYIDGHIPGAIYAFWKDLLWHPTDRRFASRALLQARLEQLGITQDNELLLCGNPVQYGTYGYWVLHSMGAHPGLRLLDGGRAAWVRAGHDLEPAEASWQPTPVQNIMADPCVSEVTAFSVVGRDEVLRAIGQAGTVLLDARSEAEYAGRRVSPDTMEVDHGAERAGRIPGARHLPFEALLADDETLKPESELRKLLASVGISDD